jgi:hypothetical protein
VTDWRLSEKQRGALKLSLDQSVPNAGVYFPKFSSLDLKRYGLTLWDAVTITSLVKRRLLLKRGSGFHVLSDEGRAIAETIDEYPRPWNEITPLPAAPESDDG